MHVLVTRAEPDASATADKVRQVGAEPIIWPLFEIRDTGVDFDASGYDGIVLTSANAVSILKQRGWRASGSDLVAYCVGQKTAEAAEELEFSRVISSNGDAGKLAADLIAGFSGRGAKLAYPAAILISFDMETALKDTGIALSVTRLYSVEPIRRPQGEIKSVLEQINGGIVLAYSKRTIEHVAKTLDQSGDDFADASLTLLAISQKVSKSVLRYPWAHVYAADRPDEQAMMEILSKLTLRKNG